MPDGQITATKVAASRCTWARTSFGPIERRGNPSSRRSNACDLGERTMNKRSEGEGLLWQFDGDWPDALRELSADMHTVDRDACWIWFQFFPLALKHLLGATPDRKVLEQVEQLRGTYQLADIPRPFPRFLYGHRY